MAKVVILSGAGISAESGISTFRDAGGLWEEYKIDEICSAGCLDYNRDKTIEFYDKRRIELEDKKPNKAHLKIKALQDKYPNDIKIITQNVDDLFEKAGCKDVLHLHGFLTELVCEKCGFIKDIGYSKQYPQYNNCPKCNANFRPNVVFFGEKAPKYLDLQQELSKCEMIVIIGTSGNVLNMDYLLFFDNIKISILNNLEKSSAVNEKLFTKILYKKTTIAIDEIAKDIENFIQNTKEVRRC